MDKSGAKWVDVEDEGEAVQIKSKFRGRLEQTLDPKGRLNFPSRFKDVLRQYDSEVLMVTAWGKHVRIYPASEWEIIENKLLTTGKEQPKFVNFVRLIVSGIIESTLDKQGRILLPLPLRTAANLSKDVVLAGMLEWVEVWDKEAWDIENQTALDNFESQGENLARLGIY